MADLFNIFEILKTIAELANKFIKLLRTIKDNQNVRDRLLMRIGRVSAIVMFLQHKLEGKTNIVESDGHQMMSDELKGLEKTLKRGLEDIQACRKKGLHKASDIAKKLREIDDDISRNQMLAMFATMACIFSEMDKMCADVKPQVTQQVHIYSTSITNQNNDKREPNKTKFHSSEKPSKKKNVDADRRASHETISDATNLQRPMERGETSGTRSSANDCVEENNVLAECRASHASLRNGSASKSASKKSVAGQGGPTSNVKVEDRPPAAASPLGLAASEGLSHFRGGPLSPPSTRTPQARPGRTVETTRVRLADSSRPTRLQRPMERGETSGSNEEMPPPRTAPRRSLFYAASPGAPVASEDRRYGRPQAGTREDRRGPQHADVSSQIRENSGEDEPSSITWHLYIKLV